MNMKKSLAGTMVFFLLLGMACISSAALVTIGTATYNDGSGARNYNLIYDAAAPLGSVVWLDYTHGLNTWDLQKSWAVNLNDPGMLAYNLNPGYTVIWTYGEDWRLPSTGQGWADQGSSYSEMSHLWYDELNFSSGDTPSNADLNATNFDNLVSGEYWTGTQFSSDFAWDFDMSTGSPNAYRWYSHSAYGLAVRRGEVSAVPIPGALYLFGSGLMCFVSFRRKKKV